VKELKLELIFLLADRLVLQDDDSDQFCALESAMEQSAPVEAVKEDRRGFLSCARWPARDIEMMGSEHQGSILKAIDVVYHFTAVDIPDLRDFFPEQVPAANHR